MKQEKSNLEDLVMELEEEKWALRQKQHETWVKNSDEQNSVEGWEVKRFKEEDSTSRCRDSTPRRADRRHFKRN